MKLAVMMAVALTALISANSVAQPLEYGTKFSIKSKFMKSDREFSVALPDSYNGSTTRYPVLMIMHGQWDTLTTLATLDHLGENIPDMIVVGVYGKSGELMPNKDGAQSAMSGFVTKELLPHIKTTYRTAPFTILSGHSNSGRFVLNQWLDNGTVFNKYYAFSPSIGDGQLISRMDEFDKPDTKINEQLAKAGKSRLWLTMASEGESQQVPFTRMAKWLTEEWNDGVVVKRFPQTDHRANRHTSLYFALGQTFPNWKPGNEVMRGGFDTLHGYYKDLSSNIGFKVPVPLDTLKRMAVYESNSEERQKSNNAIKAIRHSLSEDSNNADAFIDIGNEAAGLGWHESKSFIMKEVCSQQPKRSECQNVANSK